VLNPLRAVDLGGSWHSIDYSHQFSILSTPPVVWSVLEDVGFLSECSPWLAALTVDDPGLRAGAIVKGMITTPLPFQVNISLDVEEWSPCSLMAAAVHGDLEGDARLGLTAADEGTCLDLDWTVEIASAPIRTMARVAHPLLRWGHDRVIQSAVERLAARVRAVQGESGI
jgi:carbon monoxide dehydrogenase subunit G